jgi:DnaJ-class molecular chaperone
MTDQPINGNTTQAARTLNATPTQPRRPGGATVTDNCGRCCGEGRYDTDDGWTVVCHRCHGTGLKATPTEGTT